MGGTSKKNPRAKPARLTEFFTTTSQPPESKKGLTYPPSPTSSSRAESLDLDSHDNVGPSGSVEHTMQKLLHSFRENLQEDFRSMMGEFRSDIQLLVSRMEHIESKMADFAKSHNSLIDSHTALEEEVNKLSAKVLDLEDRSRRNNIRLRGIPETVSPDALKQFLTEMMSITLPNYAPQDLIIDRIHRIPKPKHLGPHITRVHFYHVKEDFLKTLRMQPELPDKFKSISISPDLSAATMLKRKEFSSYTKILRDNNFPYKWGFPVKVIVFRENSTIVCQDPSTIRDALCAWNLLSTPHSSPKQGPVQKPAMITPLWSEKSKRTRPSNPD